MHSDEPADVTGLLQAWSSGDESAAAVLLPLIYSKLKAISRAELRSSRGSVTMQATELVNEAFIRLAGQRDVHWNDRAHFFALAATMVRRILLDAARRRLADRRDRRVEESLDVMTHAPAAESLSEARAVEILDLDAAMAELAQMDPRQARLVELRYFGGLSIPEAAAFLDISAATAKRDWQAARAWLYRRLGKSRDG